MMILEGKHRIRKKTERKGKGRQEAEGQKEGSCIDSKIPINMRTEGER